MNATYNAIKHSMNKIDDNLDAHKPAAGSNAAMLPSPYTEDQPQELYQRLIDLVPVGTPVSATYMSMPGDISTLKTIEGTVHSAVSLGKDEPSFHIRIKDTNHSILLEGSLLTAI